MMFMMPTPPTMSEMSATLRSSLVISVAVDENARVTSVMSRILKSSSSPARMRCRSCRTFVIWRTAAAVSSVERAAASS